MSILRSKHSGWTHEGRRTPFSGGGGGPTQSTTVTSNIPEYAKPYVTNMFEATQQQLFTGNKTPEGGYDITGFRPYRPYSTDVRDYVAGFSPLQQQAQFEAGAMQQPGQFALGSGLTGSAGIRSLGVGNQYAQNVTSPQSMQAYMSPYQQGVTDIAKQAAVREAQMAQNAQNLGAARQGTYGGARQLLAQTERERNLLSNLSNIQAQGSQSAYDRALQSQQFGANLGMQGYGQALGAGAQLGQLGATQQAADIARQNQMATMGGQQQALEQQKINQAIQDYATQQQYPLMQLGVMSNMLRGLPMEATNRQTYVAQPSALQQGIGLAGAAGTFFGGRNNREGGIIGYAPGGVIDSTRAQLEQIADMPGGVQKLEQIRNSSTSNEVRKMAAEVLAEKQIEARAEQQAQQSRMGGIAAAGGGLFDTMGYAGGGILAFSNGGMGMTNPEFGGGDQSFDVRKPMTVEELFKEYPGLEGKVGISQIQDYTSGRSAPPESARAKPVTAAPVAAAPKPEVKPPAAKPEGGAPVDRGVAAATGIKSLEQEMAEQERLMGPNTANEELNAKIAERLAGMDKRASQDDRAAMRNAFLKFASTSGGIGAAAVEGAKTYGDASDAARKVRENMDLELTKMQADIKKGQRAERRGNLDAASKSFESAENRRIRMLEMQNQLKVAGIQASRASEFEKQYEAFKNDPVKFGQFRKQLTSQDETARLNAYVKADAVMANDPLKYSTKPEDKLKFEEKRKALRAEYLGLLEPTSTAAAPVTPQAGPDGTINIPGKGTFKQLPNGNYVKV